MTNQTLPWKIASRLALLIALGSGAWGFTQYQRTEEIVALLATTQSQLGTIQAQLTSSEEKVATLEASNNQAIRQATELKQETAAQAAILRAESKRDLPISVGFRRALLGKSLVVEFKNNSSEAIPFSAAVTDARSGYSKSGNVVIPPNGRVELGQMQGWIFTSGQHPALANASYRPMELSIL